MSSEAVQVEEVDDLLLACRYGDIGDVRAFVAKFGVNELVNARDERGNCVLHMCCANGHVDILQYILSLEIPHNFVRARNEAGSTPLHWACLNAHLPCVQHLVNFAPQKTTSENSSDLDSEKNKTKKDVSESESGPGSESTDAIGAALIMIQNNAGHTPLGEAELAGWDEGARWLVGAMDLELDAASTPTPLSADDVEDELGDEDVNGPSSISPEIVGEANEKNTVTNDGPRPSIDAEVATADRGVSSMHI